VETEGGGGSIGRTWSHACARLLFRMNVGSCTRLGRPISRRVVRTLRAQRSQCLLAMLQELAYPIWALGSMTEALAMMDLLG